MMKASKKENPPRDLQSRYRLELALLDQLKDQSQQFKSATEKIKAIPEIVSYLAILKRWRAPKPPAPLGQPPVIYYKPTPPSPESAVGKGLHEIEVLRKKKRKTSAFIAQSIETLARMEVEAISQGVELPPRQRPDDEEGYPQAGGTRERASQFPPEQAFLSDPEHERIMAKAQKALDQFRRARQQDINRLASSAGITEEAVGVPKAAKAAKSEEQESETAATNGAKELDPADEANTDPKIPDEVVRESAEELEWENEITYPTGHTITKTAVILNMARNSVYNWITKGKIERLSTGLISISEIKRVKTEKKQAENVQA